MNVPTQHLYNLTRPNNILYSRTFPQCLISGHPLEENYSLVEIIYSEEEIISLNGSYTFRNVDGNIKTITCAFSHLNIKKILLDCSESTTLKDIILDWSSSLETEDVESILREFPIENGRTSPTLYDVFILGVASVLVYYHFMSLQPTLLNCPFEPLKIVFPSKWMRQSFQPGPNYLSCLDRNIFSYLNYAGQVISTLCTPCIGKIWLNQITSFWHIWAPLFPQKMPVQVYLPDMIYSCIVAFSSHFYDKVQGVCNTMCQAQDGLEDAITYIKQTGKRTVQQINTTQKQLKDKYEYSLSLISTITLAVLQTITQQTQLGVNYIKEERVDLKEEFNQLIAQIKSVSSEHLDVLEDVRISGVAELGRVKQDLSQSISQQGINWFKSSEELTNQLVAQGSAIRYNLVQVESDLQAHLSQTNQDLLQEAHRKLKQELAHFVELFKFNELTPIKLELQDHIVKFIQPILHEHTKIVDKLMQDKYQSKIDSLSRDVARLKDALNSVSIHLGIDLGL